MTADNVASFPPPKPPKPTIVEILIEGATTDQPEMEMLMRIAEHHPKATRAEFEAATAAAMAALGGRQEAAKPTEPLFVPVAHVVDRIVKETMDAVEASKTDETPNLKTWTDAAVELVNQHPSKLNLISWLAMQGIENALCMEASERDLDYAVGFGSPEIEATEADVKHSQAMVEEYEEIRRSTAKSS
jgi:hypothetical protein